MLFTRSLTLIVFLVLAPFALANGDKSKILVMGDSLSAGYGIDLKYGWVTLLQERISAEYSYRVINASVSGETSGGGLARLPALLKEHDPAIVIIELGGNDGLRGHPVNIMRSNLEQMIEMSKDIDAKVVLLGMQIPPNYGGRYTRTFQQTFPELAKKHDLALVPFFLEGVAGDTELMQRDGIHPTVDAQVTLLNHVWPVLEPLLN